MTSHFSLTTLNEKIQGILPEFPGFQVSGRKKVEAAAARKISKIGKVERNA
jgi:hypothetical protein